MANIQPRYNKEGSLISYSIRVHRGKDKTGKNLKPYTTTFEVLPTWNEKTAQKKAEAFAAVFEKECKLGRAVNTKQTFKTYAEYVLNLKELSGVKHSTIRRYKELLIRINEYIGHMKLIDIKPQHLNSMYNKLSEDGMNKNTGTGLSSKTIIEHHRLISTILKQALKEQLLISNVATLATPPKLEHKSPNYFQPEQIEQIREALESVPLKWKTITHLLLITGCRRGEILGLKWSAIDQDKCVLNIVNNLSYSPERGIYETSLKTESSTRFIAVPSETIELLREYKAWQDELIRLNGDRWHALDFLFTQDDGKPMHPDSVTDWLNKFSNKYELPHINPHAFRHSMASLLYFNGVDSVSISKRLGHSKVSTTTDIYSHIIREADEQNAEKLADIFLRNKKS
jgi:Site-specific recombinase XerD